MNRNLLSFIQEHKELPNLSSCTYFASQTNLAVIKTSHDSICLGPVLSSGLQPLCIRR